MGLAWGNAQVQGGQQSAGLAWGGAQVRGGQRSMGLAWGDAQVQAGQRSVGLAWGSWPSLSALRSLRCCSCPHTDQGPLSGQNAWRYFTGLRTHPAKLTPPLVLPLC